MRSHELYFKSSLIYQAIESANVLMPVKFEVDKGKYKKKKTI